MNLLPYVLLWTLQDHHMNTKGKKKSLAEDQRSAFIWKDKEKCNKKVLSEKFLWVREGEEGIRERDRERWTMAQGKNLECEMSNVIAQPTSQSHNAWSYDKLSAYLHTSIHPFIPSSLCTFCILYPFICPAVYNNGYFICLIESNIQSL